MKQPTFTAHQSALNKALSICSKALSDNRVVPIYENFLFDIEPGKLKITACDGKIIISTRIEITGSLTMRICIPGKKLLDYVSESSPGPLLFEILSHIIPEKRETIIHPKTDEPYDVVTPEQVSFSVTIKTTSGKCTIPCELGEDYPVINNTGAQGFELPAEDLLEALYKTMFAISDDQLRPSMTGLNCRIRVGSIQFASTNGNALAIHTIKTETNIEADFIIPKKALQQIQSLSPVGLLDCEVSKSAISLSWGGVGITALLIDERYPDYLAVTPTENHIEFLTSRSGLIAALKRVLPFADTSKLVKLNIETTGLILTAENIDYAEEANETISGVSNEAILIGCNGEMLMSVLNSLADDKIWFSFSKPNRAIIITDGEKHINPNKDNLVVLMAVFIS